MGGFRYAASVEYKFRYPSERDLERKAKEEREKSEKYRLRRRLEQLERGPRTAEAYIKRYQSFKRRK